VVIFAFLLSVALGAGVRAGTRQTLSLSSEAHQQVLSVDETYIKVKGRERYLYRAVDSSGQTIDFLLTARRDAAAAKRFFSKALAEHANLQPRIINLDQNPAYPAAIRELRAAGVLRRRCSVRQSKYLNNIVEQDHRTVKNGGPAWRWATALLRQPGARCGGLSRLISSGRVEYGGSPKGTGLGRRGSLAAYSASLPNFVRTTVPDLGASLAHWIFATQPSPVAASLSASIAVAISPNAFRSGRPIASPSPRIAPEP
jgi:hypothetical protein